MPTTLTIPWGGPAMRARWGLPRFEAPGPNGDTWEYTYPH